MDENYCAIEISDVLARRAAAATNPALAKKWERERAMLIEPSVIKLLNERKLDPSLFENMAIYVAQKVRRILRAHVGLGTIDPYTKLIMENAFNNTGSSIMTNEAIGDMTGKKRPGLRFRHGSLTTASTQVCSSRAALLALGIVEVPVKSKCMVFDMAHPLIPTTVFEKETV